MKFSDALVSWAYEAVTSIPASLQDPKNWDAVFALIILAILYSMGSSIRRLNRRVASASSELAAIRSTLRKMESSLGRLEAKGSPGDKEGKDIRNLLFRVENDPQG